MTTHPEHAALDRRNRAPAAAQTSVRETERLVSAFDDLDPTDAALLIRVIARIVEIERSHGEDVALAMLDRAMAHGAEGRRLH